MWSNCFLALLTKEIPSMPGIFISEKTAVIEGVDSSFASASLGELAVMTS